MSFGVITLEAIVDKVNQLKSNHNSATTRSSLAIVADAFAFAHIPTKGPEATAVHNLLLQQCLQLESCDGSANKDSCEDKGQNISLSWAEYFKLLSDDKLKWHEIVLELFPSMTLSVACTYIKRLVEFASSTLNSEVMNPGLLDLCVGSLHLVLGVLLDVIVVYDNPGTNESIDEAVESRLTSLLSNLWKCVDMVVQLLHVTDVSLTTATASHALLLILFMACPMLSDTFTCKQLSKYLHLRSACVVDSTTSSKDGSEKEDFKWSRKSLRQQRETGCDQNKDLAMVELTLRKTGSDKVTSSEAGDVNNSGDHSLERGVPEHSSGVSESCLHIFSLVKSTLSDDVFLKIVKNFCRGPLSENNQDFYDSLRHVMSNTEDIIIGRHNLSAEFFSVQVCPLLLRLTNKELDTADYHIKGDNCKPVWLTDDWTEVKGEGHLLSQLAQEGHTFLAEILQAKQSEVDVILASGRALAGEADLKLLRRVVINRETGWRDLLSHGLTSVDFEGWWNAGFFKLFWEHEAVLSTEENVLSVIKGLCHASSFVNSEQCTNKEIVRDIRKLLSVMFQRLPPVLQEKVVLLYLTSLDETESGNKSDNSNIALSSLTTEEDVSIELTLILNKLTLANAEQLTTYMLYQCLYHPITVVKHLVHAAITTNGQTESVIKVLHSIPSLCRRLKPSESSDCILVSCLLSQVASLDGEEKQTQNFVKFLSLLIEPYELTLCKDTSSSSLYTQHVNMPGVISLQLVLHHFVFPSLSREETTDASETMDHQEEGNTDNARSVLPLEVSLAVLETLLEKSSKDEKLNVKQFHPLPLLVSLCCCYAVNYSIVAARLAPSGDSEVYVSRERKVLRQASYRCLSLLLDLIRPVWFTFTDSERAWLEQESLSQEGLHMALMAPVLMCGPEWRNICSSVVEDVCANIVQAPDKNTKRLVYLLQLGITNDTMLAVVRTKLSVLQASVKHMNIVVALKWILLTVMPCEMGRLTSILNLLLSNICDLDLDVMSDQDHKPSIELMASECLTDALLLLDPTTEPEVVMCHATTNHQACIQALVSTIPPSRAATTLPTICTHLCLALSLDTGVDSGQFTHILQVTIMDVLTKLKLAVSEGKNRRTEQRDTETQKEGRGNERRTEQKDSDHWREGRRNVRETEQKDTELQEEGKRNDRQTEYRDVETERNDRGTALNTECNDEKAIVGKRMQENRRLRESLGVVVDCVSCVCNAGVRKILHKQLSEIGV